ncbi:MAG TPA: sensor histidine kinase [Candidatus Deferrimicrobiaceae bacterium]|jgi:signal transduction histidine kinase
MTRRGPAILALLLLAGIALSGCRAPWRTAPETARLTGVLQVSMCDNLATPCPPANGPGWDCVALGPSGVARPIPHREGVGWIRLAFTLQDINRWHSPSLFISNPADAEEVWINGVRIGGEGIIGQRYVTVPGAVRVIEIPNGVLRVGGNVLTMRALFAARNVDLFNGPIRIGKNNRILLEAERVNTWTIAMESAFMTMFLLAIAFYIFLMSTAGVRTDYLLFVSFTAVYATTFLIGSLLFRYLGLAWNSIDSLAGFLATATPILMLPLVASITAARFGVLCWLLSASTAGFIVMQAFLPPLTALTALAMPWKVLLALLGCYYLLLSARAVSARREDSIPVLVGVAAYVIGSRIEVYWGLNFQDYSMGFLILSMLYALTSRHARMQSRLVSVSSRLLDAHEAERSRLARDIHDGIGQSLLALKLRLQLFSSKARGGERPLPETLDSLTKEVSGIIEDVRRISVDLRPSFMETMSLLEAIRWFAESFVGQGGIEVRVHGGEAEMDDPPSRVKDNLYRALQEILSNVVKHARATRIDVSLYRSEKEMILKVSDNGVGIVAGEGKPAGIGLTTMQERAELLGGRCSLESVPGAGTTVTLEVPLP